MHQATKVKRCTTSQQLRHGFWCAVSKSKDSFIVAVLTFQQTTMNALLHVFTLHNKLANIIISQMKENTENSKVTNIKIQFC